MIKKIITDTSIVLMVFFLFAIGLMCFTPYPTAGLIHGLFNGNSPAKDPVDMPSRLSKIKNNNNRTYKSLITQNQYDLTRPDSDEKVPVIIWVHGGAFVGGDKEDNRGYTQMLASEGYAVANMNYSLAPTDRYPSPLIQLGDLYQELTLRADTDHLDLSQVYFAGDSAGGQIVMQFLNTQMDSAYSKKVGLPQLVPVESIKGGLLFCTPFSLKDLNELDDSKIVTAIINKIGWAYTGDSRWQSSEKAQDADLLTVVNKKMPPLFITDGNTFSFEDQGRKFAEKMSDQGTTVESVFYQPSQGKLMHEYQFDLTLEPAQMTYDKVVSFLKGTRK